MRSIAVPEGSGILSLYKIADDEAEALEFAVHDNPEFAGKALKDISLKAGVLIAAVIRGKNLVVPNGGTVLKGNDLVILGDHAGTCFVAGRRTEMKNFSSFRLILKRERSVNGEAL